MYIKHTSFHNWIIFRSKCSLTHRKILLSRIVHYEMSIERDLSRYENTNNIIYHLLRVECNTFANWIHLKIFSRASKNIFTKKPKKIHFNSFSFSLLWCSKLLTIWHARCMMMMIVILFLENDPEDVRL